MTGTIFSLKSKMQRRATAHWPVLMLCIAISMVYGMNHVVLLRAAETQGTQYHPIVVNEDEALFTGAKAHAAQMGNIIVSDFNAFEYKDTHLYVLPFLSPLIMGNLARLTGGIERAFIVGDFLFPPIIFLLFYAFLFLLSERRMLSLVGAALFIFIPQFLLAVPPILPYLQATLLTLIAKGSSLYFSRVEDPQLTMPLYLAALVLFLIIFKGRRERWIIAGAGIFYGLLFYSYFYYWVYVSLALPIGILLIGRRLPEIRRRLALAMALGLLISIPHWINTYQVAHLAQYPDIFGRVGTEIGRAVNLQTLPLFSYALHAALIALVWIFWRKTDRGTTAFLITFLTPVYAVYNLQIITGFNIQPDHWFKPTLPIVNAAILLTAYHAAAPYAKRLRMKPLLLFFALLAAFLLFKAFNTHAILVRRMSLLLLAISALGVICVWAWRWYPKCRARMLTGICALVIVLLFANGVLTQYRFISDNASDTIPEQEFASYQWLAKNAPVYSVVATPSFTTNARLQLYTDNRIFLPNGHSTLASNAELWERLMLINQIYHVPEKTFRSYLTGSPPVADGPAMHHEKGAYFSFRPELDWQAGYYLFTFLYTDRSPGSSFTSILPIAIPPEVIEEKGGAYALALKTGIKNPAMPYRMDYLYYGPREQVLAPDPFVRNPTLRLVYENNGIKIYRMPVR